MDKKQELREVEEKKEKVISVKMCELMQQIEHIDMKKVERVLADKVERGVITHYAYIVHDKDVNEDGTPKKPHIHLFMKFKDSQQFKYIAKWFDVSENYINRIKGKWVTAIRYLVHANDESKYQYEDSEVKANFDFSVEKDKINNNGNGRNKRKREIIENITSGLWKFCDIYDEEKITGAEVVEYRNDINKSLEYRQRYLQLNEMERDMNVVYMFGGSGNGKTTLAKEYARKQGFRAYISSGGNNPLDDYMGQECIILDDLRPDTFPFGELLKLLDNHTGSMARARYYNKHLGECKLIIVSTIEDIDRFAMAMPDSKGEELKQLYRRCGVKMEVLKDVVRISEYDDELEHYILAGSIENPAAKKAYERKNRIRVKAIASVLGVNECDSGSSDNVVNF